MFKLSKLAIASITAASFLTPTVQSSETDPLTIVISAGRVESSPNKTATLIDTITREEIEKSGATTVVDVLRGKAGVQIRDLFGDGTAATVDMRGFGSTANSNVLIMVDGRRLNPATDGATLYLNRVNLSDVERIEVIQGSLGVMFGNQAVGGLINIITTRPKGTTATMEASMGSFGKHSAEINLGHKADNGFGVRVSAKKLTTDNYRDHNNYELNNINLLADYDFGDSNRVFIEHMHLSDQQDTPGALFLDELAADRKSSAADYAADFINTESNVTRVGLEIDVIGGWRLEGEATYRDDDRKFVQSFRGTAGPSSIQTRKVKTLNPRLSKTFDYGNSSTGVVIGVDKESTDYLIDALILQTAKQDIDAVYVNAMHDFGSNWNLSLGVRHARVDNTIEHDTGGTTETTLNLDDSVTVGSVGINYRPSSTWRVFARADQNFRFAKIEEHTNDEAQTVFPTSPEGLKNQKGASYEIGTQYKTHKTSFGAQLYQINLNDEISYDSTIGSSGANVNIDKTRRRGLTFTLNQQITKVFDAGLAIDLLDAEIRGGSHKGNIIPLVPQQKAQLTLGWKPVENWKISGELLHVGEQSLDSDYSNQYQKLDAYSVVNLNAAINIEGWKFAARINNLFDRKYSEYGVVGSDYAAFGTPAGLTLHPGNVGVANFFPAFNASPERNFSVTAKYQFK